MPTPKKRKKEPTLSPFTQITNIMPDSDKSLENFNHMADAYLTLKQIVKMFSKAVVKFNIPTGCI